MGLSFAPTANINRVDLQQDLRAFFRKVRLQKYFMRCEDTRNSDNISVLKPKATFTPLLSQLGKEVELFETLVYKEIQRIVCNPFKSKNNLPKEQYNPLCALQGDVSITIKPADKGGGVVVLDTWDYERRAVDLLSVQDHYQKVSMNRLEILKKEVRKVVEKGFMEGCICEEEGRFLLNECPIIPAFYGLPKIHKNTLDPPLRPIISCIGSLLEPLISLHVGLIVQTTRNSKMAPVRCHKQQFSVSCLVRCRQEVNQIEQEVILLPGLHRLKRALSIKRRM
ncbi:hypothetical protein NDU88_002583 [Pleurodeles waltl]|uniref:Uncharacterized protein n=1 Tax=Pleurodeles waltl TaxID=8319 RepID=A0AAV7W390_PLEWA|nr:hypothetical protein NDU88_002583 [Pleurodeles waltl]